MSRLRRHPDKVLRCGSSSNFVREPRRLRLAQVPSGANFPCCPEGQVSRLPGQREEVVVVKVAVAVLVVAVAVLVALVVVESHRLAEVEERLGQLEHKVDWDWEHINDRLEIVKEELQARDGEDWAELQELRQWVEELAGVLQGMEHEEVGVGG